jgi:pterin-4a-carbinolamine dehydratase
MYTTQTMGNTMGSTGGGLLGRLRRPLHLGGGLVAQLKPERVQEWLTARPDWRLSLRGKGLTRTKELLTVSSAAFYGMLVAHLAEAAGLPAKVILNGRRVEVTLVSGRHHEGLFPLSEEVLDLAGQIG